MKACKENIAKKKFSILSFLTFLVIFFISKLSICSSKIPIWEAVTICAFVARSTDELPVISVALY